MVGRPALPTHDLTREGPNGPKRRARGPGAIEWGQKNSQNWLKLLNDHWIGPKQYLCGDQVTIADYFGAGIVTLGELIGCDFTPYPNIQRWLGNIKRLPSWTSVNQEFYGLREMVKAQNFVRV
jgi:glutathione S-transferase